MRHKLCFHLYFLKKLKLAGFHKVIKFETLYIISKGCFWRPRYGHELFYLGRHGLPGKSLSFLSPLVETQVIKDARHFRDW